MGRCPIHAPRIRNFQYIYIYIYIYFGARPKATLDFEGRHSPGQMGKSPKSLELGFPILWMLTAFDRLESKPAPSWPRERDHKGLAREQIRVLEVPRSFLGEPSAEQMNLRYSLRYAANTLSAGHSVCLRLSFTMSLTNPVVDPNRNTRVLYAHIYIYIYTCMCIYTYTYI